MLVRMKIYRRCAARNAPTKVKQYFLGNIENSADLPDNFISLFIAALISYFVELLLS